MAGKAAAHRRTKWVRGAQKDKNESASVWQGFCVVQHGRQVHPGQTKAVKGQDSKILVTAGTIKRPLPCPIKGIEKQRIFYNVKRKTE